MINEKILEEKYRDHKLTGNYKGRRECHIESDWLLIYIFDKKNEKYSLNEPNRILICLTEFPLKKTEM